MTDSETGGMEDGPEPAVPSEAELRDALANTPGHPSVNYDLMKLLVGQGRKEEAVFYGLRAIERGGHAKRIVDVATLLIDLKLPKAAKLIVSAALDAGQTAVGLQFVLARAQVMAKEFDGALDTLNKIEESHPDSKAVEALRARISSELNAAGA
jgi:thioredoxin-like negative regulator of GroEL